MYEGLVVFIGLLEANREKSRHEKSSGGSLYDVDETQMVSNAFRLGVVFHYKLCMRAWLC